MINKLKAAKRFTESIPDRVNSLRVNPSETVVVNGFWRSGTTWLQELIAQSMNAKRIFEPLQARAGYIDAVTQSLNLPNNSYTFRNAFMPFGSARHPFSDELTNVLHSAQKGTLINPFLLRDQKLYDIKRATKPNVVVKYVKGALLLKQLRDTYGCPVVHIYRDPRSVISSIVARKNWAEGAFEALCLSDQLLNVDDGRAEYFDKYAAEIKALDKQETVHKISGYYFLTEKYLEESFAAEPDSIAYVDFDALKRNPETVFGDLVSKLGLKLASTPDFSIPSSTAFSTTSDVSAVSKAQVGSRTGGEYDEIIREVAVQFGMEKRLDKDGKAALVS